MRFGVNYTPSHGWFHFWLDPDWHCVDRDFDQIRGLGMDHVRIFPIWPYLQPNRTWINKKGVEDVRRMVHIAGEHGLDAYVDVFQGHLSSFDFLPSWLVTWHAGNMFTDPDVVAAERNLVSVMEHELSKEYAFKGLTLGNEVNQLSDGHHPMRMPADEAQIGTWLDSLLSAASGDGHMSLYSVNDGVWFMNGHPFTPEQSANRGDMTAVHAWVFNGIAQGYGANSAACSSYALYLIELAHAFGRDPNRLVWLQEMGAPEHVLALEETPEFCRKTVKAAIDSPHLWGITWWCSHDVPSEMSDFPEFEHSLGLFDERGALKPIGYAYGEVAQRYRDNPVASKRTTAVVVEVDDQGNPRDRSACGPGGSICDLWMGLQEQGERPTIVSSALGKKELAEQGIIHLVHDVHPYPARFYTAVSDPSFERMN